MSRSGPAKKAVKAPVLIILGMTWTFAFRQPERHSDIFRQKEIIG